MTRLTAFIVLGAALCAVDFGAVLNAPVQGIVISVENSTGAPDSNRTTYDWGQWTSTQAPGQNSTGAPQNGTTYDWGQHTGSTYDWGQHTKTQAPGQNTTEGPNNGTTYDWGQHTGSTYDWGQHTKTQAPNQNSTAAQNGTTYDWGQHTGSTFDWGKYTSTAPPPNHNTTGGPSTGTTYNWGQHTGSTYDWGQHTGSTYDWGQHTKPTQAPNHNETDNGNNGNNTNQNPCGAGSYACAGAPGLCLKLSQICNGVIDCPHADDEEPRICHSAIVQPSKAANTNRFRGQGFMFHIRNIKIGGRSQVKLFNQDSDRQISQSG